jgi:hypothetical protein
MFSVAGQPVLLALEHHARAGLEDERALAEQARVLLHLRTAATGHQHDLHVGAQARLHRSHPVDRDRPLAVVQQRGAAAEQRAVEVQVQRSAPAPSRSCDGSRSRTAAVRPAARRRCRAAARRCSSRGRSSPSTVDAIVVSADSGWWGLRCSSRSTCAMPSSPTARQASISIAISTP